MVAISTMDFLDVTIRHQLKKFELNISLRADRELLALLSVPGRAKSPLLYPTGTGHYGPGWPRRAPADQSGQGTNCVDYDRRSSV